MIEGRWWERWPDRLDHELTALSDAGIPYQRDEEAFAAGVYRLRISPRFADRTIPLIVTFPDLYPYFRFEVVAPEESLPYHQNPWEKNLCLIRRGTYYWDTDDTVAALVQRQVPEVISTARAGTIQEVQGRERRQAEPVGEYFPYSPSMVLIDGGWQVPRTEKSGVLVLGLAEDPKATDPLLHAAVLEVKANSNRTLFRANQRLQAAYQNRRINARWVRLNSEVREFEPTAFFDRARRSDPGAKNNRQHVFGDGHLQVWGVLYPEQVAWRTDGEGWAFICAHERPVRDVRGDQVLLRGTVRAKKGMNTNYYFSRAGRAGPQDMHVRAPELEPLRSRTVALFGLGCVGAPSAIELARAGIGELRILDHDTIDAGTISRWPLGLSVAGRKKVSVMAEWIRRDYPHTKIVEYDHAVGGARFGDLTRAPADEEILRKMTAGAALIYDATAEIGIQHFLTDLAREQKIPYIAATGTYGGWGGKVVRIGADPKNGCWLCYRNWMEEGRIVEPPEKLDAEVQPAGCGDPTFTGAGFDLAQVAMTGVRTAVSTLCTAQPSGYPATNWDVLTIAYRSSDGSLIPPLFAHYTIDKHPKCPRCQQ